jgi:hypothetical protein
MTSSSVEWPEHKPTLGREPTYKKEITGEIFKKFTSTK